MRYSGVSQVMVHFRFELASLKSKKLKISTPSIASSDYSATSLLALKDLPPRLVEKLEAKFGQSEAHNLSRKSAYKWENGAAIRRLCWWVEEDVGRKGAIYQPGWIFSNQFIQSATYSLTMIGWMYARVYRFLHVRINSLGNNILDQLHLDTKGRLDRV